MYSLSSLTYLWQICQIVGPKWLKCIFPKHHMIYNTFYFLPWLRRLGVSSHNTTQGKRVTYTIPSGFQSCSPNPCKQAGTCELSRRGDAYCRWEHFFIEVSTDNLENLLTMLCNGYLLREHRLNILDTFFLGVIAGVFVCWVWRSLSILSRRVLPLPWSRLVRILHRLETLGRCNPSGGLSCLSRLSSQRW